ncbi:MAG: ATP-binding protein [Mesorhizobium sp.]|uniref:AAA family ATPase n=1 Tax=Mesorhizobium sp. TaxID=1871066 RepID=UPI00120A5EF3|nr:AAA family ATPase [Mesorhizobium sp.]TIM30559.1 MAG: ATP-binding protein [Mesorhizobium sp.]
MTDLIVAEWKLVRLTLDDLGPFRQGRQTFDIMGADTDDPEAGTTDAASMYMILAANGFGKTTVLETIFGIYGLLNSEPTGKFAEGAYKGRAQLDIRTSWIVDGQSQTMVLSLWTGSEEPLDPLSEIDLQRLAGTGTWAKLGLSANGPTVERLAGTNELGILLHLAVRQSLNAPPTELFGLSQNMPSVLYFPADRRVVAPNRHEAVTRPDHWGYQPAVYFSSDGPEWGTSIDNVLVWLEWLAAKETDKRDRRVDDLLEFVNRLVFHDSPDKRIQRPHREELRSYVKTRHGLHPLSALSHGERAMLHILARTLTHMTSNTIVLIDEIEIHLHTRWLSRMFEALKDLLRSYPAVTMIFTTHNLDLIDLYRFETKEEALIKGGYLIETDIL